MHTLFVLFLKGGSYILFLNFEDLDQEADWFYNACSKCTAGVKDRNPGDPCIGSKCKGQPIENVVPRYENFIFFTIFKNFGIQNIYENLVQY